VWRQDVFAIANGWCEGTVSTVRFVTAVLAWGNGIRGYGPYRTGAVLTQSGASDRLESALAGLRHDAPSVETVVEAYEQFMTTDKVPTLGPAFFTKILYFAGYRRGRGGVQPLILDSVVAARLPPEAGPAHKFTSDWWSSTWRDYLFWAATQAGRPEFAGEPDAVEMALFTGRWAP
jgi:hypothetical protein